MRQTDELGRFEVQLEPGFYDVCVMSNAFTPQCKKVLIKAGGTVRHPAKLSVDPLVTEYIGFRIGQ